MSHFVFAEAHPGKVPITDFGARGSRVRRLVALRPLLLSRWFGAVAGDGARGALSFHPLRQRPSLRKRRRGVTTSTRKEEQL